MKRDWTVIAIGLCFAAVAILLVVLSWPDRLPSCDAFRDSIDGTGGEECGDGLEAWTGRSLAAAVIACVLAVIAVAAIAIGARRRPVESTRVDPSTR
jgi:ABC-type Fe3+ transport system permease subunit